MQTEKRIAIAVWNANREVMDRLSQADECSFQSIEGCGQELIQGRVKRCPPFQGFSFTNAPLHGVSHGTRSKRETIGGERQARLYTTKMNLQNKIFKRQQQKFF
jgi:hypothetical protein